MDVQSQPPPTINRASWSPNQIWLNGMINPCNPLAQGEADDYPDELGSYGDDSDYSPFDESDNNVQVFPPNVGDRNQDLITQLERNVNPLQDSNSFGIDIYSNALELVIALLHDEAL